jgi:hypothetical protein
MFLVYMTKIQSNSVKNWYFYNKLTYKISLLPQGTKVQRKKRGGERENGGKRESELHNKLMLIIYI